ncbi:hypothetical protein AWV80_04110 [Cupriavidus sp. UYMU48A]|nr:hypothetical protein AWV80_04110 [Cupriavidus sp. UYMU48A]
MHMFHEMHELARQATRSGCLICEVIDMVTTRAAARFKGALHMGRHLERQEVAPFVRTGSPDF